MITVNQSNYCWQSLLVLMLLAIASHVAASDSSAQVIGEAHDMQSDELLYREVYCARDNSDKVEVIYRNTDGGVIARKLLDYNSGSVSPSFVQQNFYSSEIIEVELVAGKVTMSVLDAETAMPKKVESAEANEKLPLVIDAGFDEFIRENWDSLVSGEKKKFLFPFVERSRMVELRVKPVSCSYPSDSDQCFRLEMSNWLIRMLVAPIELGYDPGKRRLTRYRGLSNIGDGKGGGSVVDIRYDYQNVPEQACAAVDQALVEYAIPADGKS